MYTIFYNDSYIYDPYENQECVTDVKLTANVNAAAYLDFTISPKHPLYNIVEERSGIVKVYYDDEKLFEGVVDSIEMDMYGYKSISCVSALDYLGDTCTRSYHTGSVEPTDKSKGVKAPESIDQFFQWLIDQHNQHVQNSNKTFVVGVNQGSSFSESNIIDVESTSHESTADAITNNLIDRYGGYLTLTYEGKQRVLNLYSDVHEMNAQIMDFGVNITDFTKTTTTEDQYTAVYPIGGTPENKNENDKNTYPPIDISSLPDGTTEQDADIVKSGDVIFSRSAVARYGYKEYYYSENNILDATNLLKAAIIALRKSMSPKVSINVKAIDCALFMKGYHHLAVGEAVRVRSNPHKVDEYLMVSSIDLDLQNPENTEYTLGTSYDTLTGQQSSYLRSLNSTINSAVDSVGALDKASKETAKTAQEAKANSIVAKDTANTAKDTADTAKNTANTAKDTADTAKNTANTAKDTADTAKNTADTAKNTADKAQTTAIAASNTAAEAKTTADSANNAAAELQKKTAEIDKQVEAVSNAADAASAKADQVRTDLTQQVQNVKSEMDSAVEAAQTSANEAQSAADAAQEAADKANVSTVDLDKSIKAVDAKAIAAKQAAAEAQSKAENVASDLDSANAVIEQHSTELGELTTKVTNAVNKSDSALSVSTEAKQTATEASTTATSAYADAQTALTQSTTATQTATAAKTTAESASKTASDSLKQSSAAVQTANQISTTLMTEYQTKADADKIYATQSSLKQTSDSITASVSKTYATKDALSALQNVADNAIESWRGTGVPTLTNKPASDWTTNADKKKHSGDLYYDKSTGKAYRFGSDDGETYTWELNQDTDVTKALEDAAKAQTSANNAQASATAANTAAGNAQSTANTAVSNAATAKNAADAAQSSANKAQGDVDKLKIDIPETYATKSSLTQTAESITANVESVKATANSAVTAASNAQQTADSISANLTKNYQTKSQADTIYATKASLKATSDSISAEVTKAQGTADGAVTAASKAQQTADAVTLNLSKNYQTKAQNDAIYATQTSLKATSDSLSANITANANTAQSAVDKATSLEANLNGFKTTVSQTYGRGSNLWVNPTFDADKPQITSLVDDVTAPNGSGVNLLASRDHHNDATSFPVVPGHTYVITAHIKRLKGDIPLKAGIWYTARTSGNSWDRYCLYESASDLSDGWLSATWRFSCPNGKSRGCVFFQIEQPASNGSTQWYVANVVCVDVTGLQPAGDYATNSSLTQTANSIKAQVTEVSKTANSAMSKATTVEQTANGLQTTVTEQAEKLDDAVTTTSQVSQRVDSLSSTITQVQGDVDSLNASVRLINPSFETGNTTGWKFFGYQNEPYVNNVDPRSGTYKLVFPSINYDGKISLENDAKFPVKAGEVYRISLSVNPDSTITSVSVGLKFSDDSTMNYNPQFSPGWHEYSGTVTIPSGKTEAYLRLAMNVKAGNTVRVDSVLIENISDAKTATDTANSALSKSSSVEQNLNSFKTTVAETYTTKNDVGVGNLIKNGDFSDGMTNWTTNGGTSKIVDGTYGKQFVFTQTGTNTNGSNRIYNDTHKHINGQAYEVSFYAKADKSSKWHFGPTGSSKAASTTLDTTLKQYAMQYQADNTTVFSVWTDNPTATIHLERVKLSVASGYYATNSSLTQTANSIKAEVSETYTTKNDFDNLTIGGRNLLLNSNFSKGTDNWNLELQNSGKGTVEAQSLSGFAFATTMLTINVTNNTSGPCRIYQLRSPNPMQTDTVDTVSFWATASESVPVQFGRLEDQRFITVQKGWHYYKATVPKWNGSNAFVIGFKNGFIGTLKITNIMWEHASKASQWSPAPEDLQPAGDYSTKSYVDQTAESVALGVVQNYKGSDGSGLATKSDITVATDSITSTVANTYATKSGVTQEISSKITQNNNSLDVKFATKTETQEAQNTANTANSNATNAQSRIGNVEDCITLTSNGVRAGKQSNGAFTGVSALVNTDGSFDLLDSNGQLLTRINRHTFRVTGDNGVGSGYITLSQSGINITVMPTDDPNEQYYIRIGSGGISFTSPDGAKMNCSATSGMVLETEQYGRLAISPQGLQFTNDQGWGLQLGANGWSLKWAGNHKIATGPTAGKLYIDGHEIVTK